MPHHPGHHPDHEGAAVPPAPVAGPSAVAQQNSNSSPQDKSRQESASAIAKWLVPSVTVLFGVVGYLVQTAQESLLGLGSGPGDFAVYVSSAADFLLDVVATLAGLVNARDIALSGIWPPLVAATFLAAGALSAPWWGEKLGWKPADARQGRRYLLAVALVGVVLVKFVVFDMPLSRIENVILDVGGPGSTPESFGALVLAKTDLPQFIASRSTTLWNDIGCSRVAGLGSSLGLTCTSHEQSDYKSALKGEFLAQLWTMGLIASLALVLLKASSHRPLSTALSVLALAYLLTVPYAYGKLLKSTYYYYGTVTFAPLPTSYKPDDMPEDVKSMDHALILSRTSASVDMLIMEWEQCSALIPRTIRLSSFAPSQIIAIREIYRQDVIAWALANRKYC